MIDGIFAVFMTHTVAGLTSRAFYNHFSLKNELLAELVNREIEHSCSMFAGELAGESIDEWIESRRTRYLNWKHVHDPVTGCVVPSLVAGSREQISRAERPLRMPRAHA